MWISGNPAESVRVPPKRQREKTWDHSIATHRTALYRVALSLTRNACEAEDLVQETLVRAYEKLHTFRSSQNGMLLFPWLRAILRNEFYNRWRERQRYPAKVCWQEMPTDETLLGSGGWISCPENEVESRLFVRAVEAATVAMPPLYREVFVLVTFEGLSYTEAAKRLDLPIGTVRSRLFRARRRALRTLYSWCSEPFART